MASTLKEYKLRRFKMLSYLGNCCVKCGSTENLEIDHVDHSKKNFDVSKNWALAWSALVKELNLCQILCKSCHLKKSKSDGSLAKGWTTQPRLVHGSVNTYKKHGCRCELCITVKERLAAKERERYKLKKRRRFYFCPELIKQRKSKS